MHYYIILNTFRSAAGQTNLNPMKLYVWTLYAIKNTLTLFNGHDHYKWDIELREKIKYIIVSRGRCAGIEIALKDAT